ncbi:MAG: DNA repair protein RadC, partial [Bacteroidetes bacterium]|nr:DNA repair protein RadC [Bacteroidota bacterium]
GNPEPSSEDVAVTKQLVESGKILGIPVNDHIIIAGNSFTSFAEQGLL